MIHFREEGHPLRQGINIYPPKCWRSSRGFWLRIGKWTYQFRWSGYQKRLLTGWGKV